MSDCPKALGVLLVINRTPAMWWLVCWLSQVGQGRKIGFGQHASYPGKADKCLSRLFGCHLPANRGVAASHRATVYRSPTGLWPLIQEYERLPHGFNVVYHVIGLNLDGGKESRAGHLLPPSNGTVDSAPIMRLFRLRSNVI
ncbi:hypothetical protein [Mesorhizobium waimense]|uniref:hypothetical protein n=1 Tax=Mesorhizobium waimense TaxID=1300307 RepID=UPI003CCB3263